MDVLDVINLFVEPAKQRVKLRSNNSESVVFEGYLKEIPTKLIIADVTSVDNLDTSGVLKINIDEID